MTQKELLYVEDAVGHESSIIKILNNAVCDLDDESFKSFMKNEISNHQNIKDNLMSLLKEKANG